MALHIHYNPDIVAAETQELKIDPVIAAEEAPAPNSDTEPAPEAPVRTRCKIIRTATVPGSLFTFCHGQLSQLRKEGYRVLAVSSPGAELNELGTREGVRTASVFMERRMAPMRDLKSLWKLYRLFRRERPTMVHSMTPKAGLLSMMAARLAGVPVRVHTFTGLIWPTATGNARRLLMATDRLLCACATHINPEGEGVRNDLANAGITRKPMRILGYGNVRGIDPDHYARTPQVMDEAAKLRRNDVLTYVFVGRINRDKGITELVDAFMRLNAQHPDTRLVLVGRIEQLDPLPQDTLHKIDTCPAIEAVGNQSDVRPWLAAADVLAFPSYREGFPNVVLEAGAMDLPAVVTDINGSREIIEEGFNGLIVPPRNTDALYNAMLEMYVNPERRNAMGSVARERVLSRWSRQKVTQALLEFYNEILPD